MKQNYDIKTIQTSNLNITSQQLEGDVNETLLKIIKRNFEGVCNKGGYVMKNTIELVNRSIGKVQTIDNISYINYNITYSCNIIIPSVDTEYECIVDSKSKVGLIAYIKIEETDTIKESPFIIIVPKEYVTDDKYESINNNQKIKIKVRSFRIKYLAKQIQIVGSLL